MLADVLHATVSIVITGFGLTVSTPLLPAEHPSESVTTTE